MHVKAKQMAFGGLLLAVTVVCMARDEYIVFAGSSGIFCRDCDS